VERVDDWGLRPPGKLTEAARARAFELSGRLDPTRPLAIDEQSVAEFAALGVAVAAHQVDEEEVIQIWDINAAAFEAFLALETQWRVVGLAGLATVRLVKTGLDYCAVEMVLRRRELLDHPTAFDDIRVMENASLAAWGALE
jgi:hypothetical protein